MAQIKFEGLLSLAQAAAIWQLDDSTLRKAVAAGRLIEGADCLKYGKQWIVQATAMCRVYGAKPYQRWIAAGRPPARRQEQPQIEGQVTLLP